MPRCDRPPGDPILFELQQNDVLVAVVFLRSGSDLRPLPAEEAHQVGGLGIARQILALTNRALRLLPLVRSQPLGVIVDRPEVERRAVAREVAGVGGGMGALPLEHRQAHQEGIEREGGVCMQIAEEDLLVSRPSALAAGAALCGGALLDPLPRNRLGRDLTRLLAHSEPAPPQGIADEPDAERQDEEAPEKPSHAGTPRSSTQDAARRPRRRDAPLARRATEA